jgi:hypothetical protein
MTATDAPSKAQGLSNVVKVWSQRQDRLLLSLDEYPGNSPGSQTQMFQKVATHSDLHQAAILQATAPHPGP